MTDNLIEKDDDKVKRKSKKAKKFFRNLFSGFFVIILLLLAQVGIFIFVQFFLDDFLISVGLRVSEDSSLTFLAYFVLKSIERVFDTCKLIKQHF